MVKFSLRHLIQSFFLIAMQTGSAFISSFVSLFDLCHKDLYSKAIANSKACVGVDLGSVQSFSCIASFLNLCMKMCTRLSVCIFFWKQCSQCQNRSYQLAKPNEFFSEKKSYRIEKTVGHSFPQK